jgi:hypothetical protein
VFAGQPMVAAGKKGSAYLRVPPFLGVPAAEVVEDAGVDSEAQAVKNASDINTRTINKLKVSRADILFFIFFSLIAE